MPRVPRPPDPRPSKADPHHRSRRKELEKKHPFTWVEGLILGLSAVTVAMNVEKDVGKREQRLREREDRDRDRGGGGGGGRDDGRGRSSSSGRGDRGDRDRPGATRRYSSADGGQARRPRRQPRRPRGDEAERRSDGGRGRSDDEDGDGRPRAPRRLEEGRAPSSDRGARRRGSRPDEGRARDGHFGGGWEPDDYDFVYERRGGPPPRHGRDWVETPGGRRYSVS